MERGEVRCTRYAAHLFVASMCVAPYLLIIPRISSHPAARTNSETFLHIFCTIGHYPGW